MKKLTIISLLILISIAAFANRVKYDPYLFQPRTIIGCFTKTAIPNIDGKLDYTIQNGVIHTGIETIDALADQYQIVDLKQAHPYIIKPEWNDKGLYLQNTYRFFLASNDQIDAAVEALHKDPNLIYAELEAINYQKFVPDDPMLPQQYIHPLLQSFEAWDYVTGSHDVVVAITDSGVKWNHPDLMGNIWINPYESPGMSIDWENGLILGGDGIDAGEGGGKVDDLVGWDFVENDNNPIQPWENNDHGTHVAGCAGAVGNNAIGVVGTSPNVSILACKGAPSNANSSGVQYAYDQILYAGQLGADIINASWGGVGSGTYPNSIVDYVTNLGATVVAAAGNENMEHSSSYQDYPADCNNSLNVAATNHSDIKAGFSDYGEPIDICAPGDNILSTVIADNGYASYGGTSMASPVTAGVAALVKSLHPEMSSLDLRNRLMMTADPIDDINSSYAGLLGAGRINAFTATMYDKIPNINKQEVLLTELEGDGDGVTNPGETISMNIKLENIMTGHGILWMDANDLSATIRTNHPGITLIDSVSSFGQDGYLYAGSSAWNQDEYVFDAIADLPSEPIPFELVIDSNADQAYPYHKVIPFNVELSLVQQGWPFDTGGASGSSPILLDVNADNNLEVVFGDQTGKINIIDATGSPAADNFPLNLGATVVGSIAMAKLQDNNYYDFAASLSNNNVVAFNSNGDLLFAEPAGSVLRSGPVIANLLTGSPAQVIALAQNGSLLVFNSDGSAATNFPVALGGAFLGSPAVADLNGDGNLEILAWALSGHLHAIDPLTGSNIDGFPVLLNGGSQNSITIANIDSDAHPEILLATSSSGLFYALNHDGSIYFEKNIGGQIKSSPVVADVNNDGNKEIIIIAANGDLYVMDTSGENLPGMPVSVETTVECTPVVARFDYGSDLSGIIFGDTAGKLHSVRIDGTESYNFPIPLNGNIKVSAALADLDRDGDLDIVIPDNSSYFVLDIKRDYYSIEWPCFTGSYSRAGNVYQPTPNTDAVSDVLSTTLNSAYPNPFNPTTTLSFSLQNAGEVSLVIYNQKGQKVRSLIHETMPSGKHQIVWNGKDDNGRQVSSGLYFYRMKSGKYSSTRKMIMMK
ncbi:MAG: serine protease [Candidatus Cloacimonadota bacterium]|nr:serine protease [Candidatus Cloacimonadota bacterium]